MCLENSQALKKQLDRARRARQQLPAESISGLHLAVQIKLIQDELNAHGSVYTDSNGDWLLVLADQGTKEATAYDDAKEVQHAI